MLSKTKIVNNKGKRKHSSLFSLIFLKGKQEYTRCAIVVPKKIYNKATQRNKIKRKILNFLKEIYPQIPTPYDIVVMVRSNLDEKTPEDIQNDLLDLIKSLN
jgi:ribonuclease P protein component